MVEATPIVQQTPTPNQAQRQSMSRAVRVLAMQVAKQAVKRAIQARGQKKLATFAAREITVAAEVRPAIARRGDCEPRHCAQRKCFQGRLPGDREATTWPLVRLWHGGAAQSLSSAHRRQHRQAAGATSAVAASLKCPQRTSASHPTPDIAVRCM